MKKILKKKVEILFVVLFYLERIEIFFDILNSQNNVYVIDYKKLNYYNLIFRKFHKFKELIIRNTVTF